MAHIKLERIDSASADALDRLHAIRAKLSAQGNVVSQRGKELTQAVFGEPLPPARAVERICNDVRQKGLTALLHYTEKLDKARLEKKDLRVPERALADAHRRASPDYLETIRRVRQRILAFQHGLLHTDAALKVAGSHELRLRYRPMRRVGICVPGGAAAYPSTLLMTVCPAKAAGVKELAVVMPPTANGAYNEDLLAACHELEVSEVYRVGGAQAVAALAYGVEGMPAVDMIVGPGNLFVTLAKRHVFGHVAIDMLAGPTEVVVIADDSASPTFVASDLIAQAEHAPGASILVSWSPALIDKVEAEIERQLAGLARSELARESLEQFGSLLRVRDAAEAVEWTNLLAPEHLQITAADGEKIAEEIDNAGAVFLGPHTPVAVGDYVAGPSHVLPTSGTARFASGLSANDFLRRSSYLAFTREGLQAVAPDLRLLAVKEGLTGHAASVDVRLELSPGPKRGS